MKNIVQTHIVERPSTMARTLLHAKVVMLSLFAQAPAITIYAETAFHDHYPEKPYLKSEEVGQHQWQLVVNDREHHIKIYTWMDIQREVGAFRAVTFIPAEANLILQTLIDPDQCQQWLDRCKFSKVIKQSSENHFYMHTVSDVPWPVQDREVVVRCHVEKEEHSQTIRLLMHAVPGMVPPSDHRVRIQKFSGAWTLNAVEGGTMITYEGESESGGHIPLWLARSYLAKSPQVTLKNLQSKLSLDVVSPKKSANKLK